jgi:hypothetical protein
MSANQEERHIPIVLRGPTAGQYGMRGIGISALAIVCVGLVALSGFFGEFKSAWGFVWGVLGIALALSGFMNYRAVDPKNLKEVAAGYTTLITPLVEHPELWYLHEKSLQVLAPPNTPKPARTPSAKKWARMHPELPYAHRAAARELRGRPGR